MVSDYNGFIDLLTQSITTGVSMVGSFIAEFFDKEWLFGLKPGWIILAVMILGGLVVAIVRSMLRG